MFGKAKIHNPNVWKSQNPEVQCLEKPKSRIPMFGKAKIQNFNVRKSKTLEFNKLQNLQNYISLPSVGGVWIFSGITYNPVINQVLSGEQQNGKLFFITDFDSRS